MTKRLSIALIALVALVLVAVLPVSATYFDINNTLSVPGAVVYIGEQQLNFNNLTVSDPLLATDDSIGWWASAAQLQSTSPTVSYPLNTLNLGSLYVSPAAFGNYPGNWYGVANGKWDGGPAIFNAQDPSLAIDVWDLNTATTVTSGSCIQGDYLAFRINTNLQSALDPSKRLNDATPGAAQVGNVDIKVKSSTGNTYIKLFNGSANFATTSLTSQNVTLPLWFWGTMDGNVPSAANSASNWSTGASDQTGQLAYPAGVYTVIAQSRLNGMYDNYLNGGATYTGKTISQPATVTIASNTVSISANVDSVVRSKAFSVTITGKPNAVYHLWVKGTATMDGTYDNQPPIITPNQKGVAEDSILTPDGIADLSIPGDGGNYKYQNSAGLTLWQDVAHGTNYGLGSATVQDTSTALGNGTFLYANITLDQTGTRTIQWSTTNWTKAQQYTFRVEQNFGGATGFKSDEVIVQVQKGAVTIVAAGSQSYYLGEEVQFSGTNTESQYSYLFITGPNLKPIGSQIQSLDPRNNAVVDGHALTFQQVSVLGDNTWSWQWGTAAVALDAGTYTVYAVSQPEGTDNLNNVAYGTVSIIIKKPFVSATASQSTVAQGDDLYITGTAEGQPSLGVQIWILGKNFAAVTQQGVDSDGSFSYDITGVENTQNLAPGQYFVVVQHPMQNGVFDVYANPLPQNVGQTGASSIVYTASPTVGGSPTQNFALAGSGSLQGSDAAEALVQAINSPNVDDTYTKLQFLVETPVITIDPVGDRHVGDKFTITATTNLEPGDNIFVTVYSSSFQPTDKTQNGEFSGAADTVSVNQGNSSDLNTFSFDVDASTFKPDEYLVTATCQGGPTASGTALFNVLQAPAQTATPPPVATVTTVPTTVATPMPTTVAPTKTPTQPGFGALVALIGLAAVALITVRRH